MASDVHLIPFADLTAHETDVRCICGPTVIEKYVGECIVKHAPLNGKRFNIWEIISDEEIPARLMRDRLNRYLD